MKAAENIAQLYRDDRKKNIFCTSGGWVGWLEKWGLKLISTQVVVEVEVGVELGKNKGTLFFATSFLK